MRENTRCDVDEPMSTPTLSRRTSSSVSRVRPVDEKKIRPPWSSLLIRCGIPAALTGCTIAVLITHHRAPVVKTRIAGGHHGYRAVLRADHLRARSLRHAY